MVVGFGGEVDAIEGGTGETPEVDGVGGIEPEVLFAVGIEVAAGKGVEGFFAVEGVVGGGEAAAGDGGDDVDFIEERAFFAGVGDGVFLEFFEDAVGECGGTRAAAGECQEDEEVVGVFVGGREVIETVAGVGVEFF